MNYDEDAKRIDRIVERYHCSRDDARNYLELREEGYSAHQASLMAGIADPHDPDQD